MLRWFVLPLLLLAGCSHEPPTYPGPKASAPEWDLNVGKWPGTNDLIHTPEDHRG